MSFKNLMLVATTVACFNATTALSDDATDPFYTPRRSFYEAAADRAPRDEEPQRNIALQIGVDFKNVFTRKENLWIMGVGLGAGWAAHRFDQDVTHSSFNTELNPESPFDIVFESGEVLGNGYAQIGTAFVTYGFGKLFKSPEVAELGRDLVRAQVVTGVITFGIKTAVGRQRPDSPSATSFPSGHTSSSFATATVLQRRYGWKFGLPAYVFAGYVAGSRVAENRHYVSDVIVGAAIGIMVGRTVTVGIGGERFALAPLIVPRGAGIQLAWLANSRSRSSHP